MSFFAFFATFFTFSALVLEIFTIVGNIYNQPFLRSLYFARFTFSNQFIQFGLWNYCIGTGTEIIQCSPPVAAFDWTQASILKLFVRDLPDLSKFFLAIFILYWVALGLTFFALLVTSFSHFRRGPDLLASISTFTSFIIMVAVFVMTLVISLRGINQIKDANPNITGSLGPSMWMTLGALAGLMLASFMYCATCIFGPSKHVREAEEDA
ncbi:actin cortical patch SUR7/pH-response regulator pali [Spinellus fusiger]|nr:actin cortical patch SUR7/pH-response regulator pali [Spinellus fusiger]